MNRGEHITWCKQRALAELDAGGPDAPVNAVNSLVSDLPKHPDTREHTAAGELAGMLLFGGHLSTDRQVREWIDGVQ